MKTQSDYFHDILECIARIRAYTSVGKEAFMTNTMIQDAVIRNFEIIGEAVKKISRSFRKQHPEIDWRAIAGFRDILIHNYGSVDVREVWMTVERDLPKLLQHIEGFVRE